MANYIDKIRMFNTQCSTIKLGTMEIEKGVKLYISISEIKEEFKGKEPTKGAKMYDYDDNEFISLNNDDIIIISNMLKLIRKGLIPEEDGIKHGDKTLTVGLSENGFPFLKLNNIPFFFNNNIKKIKTDDGIVELNVDLEKVISFFDTYRNEIVKKADLSQNKSSNSSSSNNQQKKSRGNRSAKVTQVNEDDLDDLLS